MLALVITIYPQDVRLTPFPCYCDVAHCLHRANATLLVREFLWFLPPYRAHCLHLQEVSASRILPLCASLPVYPHTLTGREFVICLSSTPLTCSCAHATLAVGKFLPSASAPLPTLLSQVVRFLYVLP